MIQQLFTNLTHLLQAAPLVAITAAGVWGILSILLSPCHLASIPLIVGFISMQGQATLRRAFLISFSFSVGILFSILAIGIITALSGRMIGNVGPWGNYAIAAVFLVFGLVLLDIIPLPWSAPSDIKIKSKGIIGAFLLGLIFGIALGPCTFAFMAPILGLTFKMGQAKILWGFALIGAYAAGHCGMIVIAGTSTNFVQTILNYNEKSHIASIFKRICGILVLAAGLYMIYKA